MNSKLGNKLGLKPGASKSDMELERLKKENAALKKTVDDMSKSKGKFSDAERTRLLEKILDLKTQNEKCGQEITKKNEDIANLKEALKSNNSGNAFIGVMEQKVREAEKISEDLTSQLYAVTARCKELETRSFTQQNSENAESNIQILEGQLKDALEKNQQWLTYDQQREAYVQGIMARIFELEQQLGSANQALSKQAKDSSSEAQQEEMQKYYDKLLIAAKKELEGEKKTVAQLHSELSSLRGKYEDKKKEMEELSETLQSKWEEKQQSRDERKRLQEKMQRLKMELELSHQKLDEEKQRSAQLSNQVHIMQNSTLKQQDEHKRIVILEQQIQKCTSDFENEKVDRQNVQHQLYKVLKELRKAREQITRLEPMGRHADICCIDPSSNFHNAFDEKLSIRERHQSPKQTNLLDESFLECPKCKAVYPTSQHRELLSHLDYCNG
ncbi:centrosomal protein of 55 kDa [Discoglossus pictus]